MIALKQILVATDFGEASGAALTYGRAFARRFSAKLTVLHVLENVYSHGVGFDGYMGVVDLQRDIEAAARKQLEGLVTEEDRRELGATPVMFASTQPAYEIARYAKDHHTDLIVIGTHGRTALAHLLMGSVAEKMVRIAPCPVLTVRHPEHEFVLPDRPEAVAQTE